ncbi:hypothetical protein ACGF3G_05550 [Streptomyces sp. NPDC048179]|uniref:hypothetical protein n=1 Tax=Streptomyces sp. NPDC048179 TaxID=3365506 RepID=UPI00371BA0AB
MSAVPVTKGHSVADAPQHAATAPDGLAEGVLPESRVPGSGTPEAGEAAAPALTVLGSEAAAVCTDGVCTL